MEFKVRISGSPSHTTGTFIIRGENLLDAVKRNFHSMLYKSSAYHVPYEYPITVMPVYKKGILGGEGGVELNLEWLYSTHKNRPALLHTGSIWIYGEETDLPNIETFVMEGN